MDFPNTPTRLLRLMANPRTGEVDADWSRFTEVYAPVIRAYVSMEGVSPGDVDDVVQDVFVRLVEVFRRDAYDRGRGRFRTYLVTIMRRLLIDRLRRRAAAHADDQVPLEEADLVSERPDAATAYDIKWRAARHAAALEHVFTHTALSPQSREIYRAYAQEGEKAESVAKRFGVTAETVRGVKLRVNRMVAALEARSD